MCQVGLKELYGRVEDTRIIKSFDLEVDKIVRG